MYFSSASEGVTYAGSFSIAERGDQVPEKKIVVPPSCEMIVCHAYCWFVKVLLRGARSTRAPCSTRAGFRQKNCGIFFNDGIFFASVLRAPCSSREPFLG